MQDWLSLAPSIGALAAVTGTGISAATLRRAGNNLREQLRPVVVIELRSHPTQRGVVEIVVKNYGQLPARDLTITFDPEIRDPDPDSTQITSGTSALVRRLGRTISVLAPGAEIVQFYHDFPLTPEGFTFIRLAPTPEHATTTAVYFGPDGFRYEDDFELDVHLVGLATRIVEHP